MRLRGCLSEAMPVDLRPEQQEGMRQVRGKKPCLTQRQPNSSSRNKLRQGCWSHSNLRARMGVFVCLGSVTEHHRLGAFKQQMLLFHCLEDEGPGSRSQQLWGLMTPLPGPWMVPFAVSLQGGWCQWGSLRSLL